MNIRVFRAIYDGFVFPTHGPDVELSIGRIVLLVGEKVMIRDNDDHGHAEWHEALIDAQFVLINESLFEEVFAMPVQRKSSGGRMMA